MQVSWGAQSEIEAMKLLIRAALSNPLNQRFVMLCEATIPLYPATVVYSQLMAEKKSRIAACQPDNLWVRCSVSCHSFKSL